MKNRLLTGWNYRRVIFLIAGTFLMAQAFLLKEWAGLIVGGYFALMGLFAFGCASFCAGGSCHAPTSSGQSKENDQLIDKSI